MISAMKVMTSPKLAIFGIIFGPIVGIYFKSIAENFAFINNTYLSLMQLVVIPLIIVTIMSGVLELSKGKNTQGNVLKIIWKALLLFIIVSIVSVMAMLATKPWAAIMSNPALLTIIYKDEPIIQATSIGINDVIEVEDHKAVSFGGFIASAIPSNVFDALSQGEILQIIIFFSVFTIGIASITNKDTSALYSNLQELMSIFRSINDSILSILPFLSFFIIAYQSRIISIETLHALLTLVLCIIILMSSLIVIFIAIVIFKSNKPFLVVIEGMGKCMMLAILSSSTLISSSLVMKVMTEELKFNKNNVELIVPIGAGLLRFGSLSIYFIATILTAYLFNQILGFYEYVMIMIFSIFATFVSISANNPIAFYQTLSIVMEPLGFPSSSVRSIMISIDFLLEPLVTVNNVLGICALTALYAGYQEE